LGGKGIVNHPLQDRALIAPGKHPHFDNIFVFAVHVAEVIVIHKERGEERPYLVGKSNQKILPYRLQPCVAGAYHNVINVKLGLGKGQKAVAKGADIEFKIYQSSGYFIGTPDKKFKLARKRQRRRRLGAALAGVGG